MSKTNLFTCLCAIALFFSGCAKKEDATPIPSLVGKWTFKTAKIPIDDANGKTTMVDVTAKAAATIDFTTTGYTVSQTVPYVYTKGSTSTTLQFANAKYKITTTTEIATEIGSDPSLTAAEKKGLATMIAGYEKEGIKYIVAFDDFQITAKNGNVSGSLGWDWFSIKNLTSTSVTLELFGGEIFSGDPLDPSTRLQMVLGK